jgi:predicted transcriptional regulator
MTDNTSTFMELTASIVSAYVRHNSVPSAELPALIGQVHTAHCTPAHRGESPRECLGDALRTAVPIKKSILAVPARYAREYLRTTPAISDRAALGNW